MKETLTGQKSQMAESGLSDLPIDRKMLVPDVDSLVFCLKISYYREVFCKN
jgi:hypothetical protein